MLDWNSQWNSVRFGDKEKPALLFSGGENDSFKSLVIDGGTWKNVGVQMRKAPRDGYGIGVTLKENSFKEHV